MNDCTVILSHSTLKTAGSTFLFVKINATD